MVSLSPASSLCNVKKSNLFSMTSESSWLKRIDGGRPFYQQTKNSTRQPISWIESNGICEIQNMSLKA